MSLARVLALALWSSLAVCSLAEAQRATDLAQAEASFRAGAAAYAAGDYPAAIQALEAAYALTPLPAIAFSLAQAERRQYFVGHDRGHLERAVDLYRLYIEQVQAGGRRADALDALSQLEPLRATLPASDAAGVVARTNAPSTRLMITSEVPGASIALDGAAGVPSPLIREVEPGVHRVIVEAPGFHLLSREVTAISGALVLTEITLEERPSTLVISTPPEAEIFVDGVFAHQGGQQVTLQLRGGTHQLAVAARGRRVAQRRLELARGKTEALHISLENTAQRSVARVLFVTGGVGLGVGLTLGVFALRDQGRAENFIARRDKANVSQAELRAYQDDVSHRDRYRLASGITLGFSAGLFLTGLFLHQFDRPSARDIQRTIALLERVHVAPVLGRASWGCGLQASF